MAGDNHRRSLDHKSVKLKEAVSIISLGILIAFAPKSALAEGISFTGSVQHALSFNMANPVETAEDDRYDLSMSRTTFRLDAEAKTEHFTFVTKARVVQEQNTPYLKRLQALGANSFEQESLVDKYSESTLREAYLETDLGERTTLRLGKQQVAWGETDFFQALDLVHGFDYTWRSFLEPANEDLRKPVFLANFNIQVPEADGALQVILRPGWDRDDSIGNTYDIFGGRWANQPYKGFDFRNLTPYNYDHPEGSSDDFTGGFRWTGLLNDVNYSLVYLKTFNPDPVISPANLGPGSNMTPFQTATTKGVLGEVIYPKIDVFGATLSAYAESVDAVFSSEVALLKDYAYNFGYTNAVGLPGFNGVVQKDVVRTMVRMDKTLPVMQEWFGAEKPSFFSVQVFDNWIQDFDESENIVNLVGQGQARKEHSTLATGILSMSYMNGRIVPEFVVGTDLSYGGGFFVPSVTWTPSTSWKFKAELDLFWNSGSREPSNAATERNSALFGYFDNNDQLYVSATYQF